MTDYTALRKEVSAVHPDHSSKVGISQELADSISKTHATVTAYAEAHPDFTALELRRVCYGAIVDNFVPFIYLNSPFYYEAGINGGWGGTNGSWGNRKLRQPAYIVYELCNKFFKEIPQQAIDTFWARRNQRYILCCGFFTDEVHHVPPLRVILQKGFSGIYQQALETLPKCETDEEREFVKTAIEGLEAIHSLQLKFADKAREILQTATLTEQQRKFMTMIAESAEHAPWEAPRTFYEALNTLWFVREILALVDGLYIYALGRLDAFLIDFYERDIANGILTKAEAYDLICRFLTVADCHYDGLNPVEGWGDHELEIPLTLGGCDAEGKPLFNDITRMALQAHLELDIVFPKLHCRLSSQSPHEYLQMIANMVASSHCVFALFNDERQIPALMKLGVPLEEARQYICTGCWDGNIDGLGDTDTANYVSVIRVMEAMIYQDAEQAKAANVNFESWENCQTFEELRDLFYRNFITFLKDVLHDYTAYGPVSAKVLPYPAYSACLKGCLESRKDVRQGGSVSKPRVITLAFTANVIDALCAIKTLCFDRKVISLPEFLDAVRSNWQGHDDLRAMVLACPHWGDNSPLSNSLMDFLFSSVYRDIKDIPNDRGGQYVLAAWIYREFRFWGENTKATPDGRHDGDYLAQGIVPSEFRCKESITTVLNAIGSIDNSNLFASNVNLSFDRNSVDADALEAIFRAFAAKGIHLLQPNCFRREDLLDAQIHPERHSSLMIKVCGFSARFIALSKDWQTEVLQRHQFQG